MTLFDEYVSNSSNDTPIEKMKYSERPDVYFRLSLSNTVKSIIKSGAVTRKFSIKFKTYKMKTIESQISYEDADGQIKIDWEKTFEIYYLK